MQGCLYHFLVAHTDSSPWGSFSVTIATCPASRADKLAWSLCSRSCKGPSLSCRPDSDPDTDEKDEMRE